MDRNYYFTRPSLDRELKLTFSRGGQMIGRKDPSAVNAV